VDGEPTTRPPASGHPPQGPVAWVDSVHVGVLVAAVVVLAVLVGVVLGESRPSQARTPAAAAGRPATATGTPAPEPPPPAVPRAEEAELRAVAAGLSAPVSLTAPAAWVRWGTARPTYPHDVDGCPHLATRLTAALGTAMGYWQGTLPQGPYGCTWVPVPPSLPGPSAYQLDVGWSTGGTTTGQLSAGPPEGGAGTRCPEVEVPAVGPGAELVRCEGTTDVEYTLVLRDAGGPGVWRLHARARDDARHTPAEALDALVGAVTRSY
jgi:hypothetical protein